MDSEEPVHWPEAILHALGVDYFNPTSEEKGAFCWEVEEKGLINKVYFSTPAGSDWAITLLVNKSHGQRQICIKLLESGEFQVILHASSFQIKAGTIEEIIKKLAEETSPVLGNKSKEAMANTLKKAVEFVKKEE